MKVVKVFILVLSKRLTKAVCSLCCKWVVGWLFIKNFVKVLCLRGWSFKNPHLLLVLGVIEKLVERKESELESSIVVI